MIGHVPGVLRLRLADGATVALDDLAAALGGLGAALDAVDRVRCGDPEAEGMLWQLAADVRDVVELARALGVLEGRHA